MNKFKTETKIDFLSFFFLLLVPREMAKNDVHKATMVWNLLDEKKKGRTQESEYLIG